MEKIVGVGEYAVSGRHADKIKTFALASCVAVTAYSPSRRVGGMVHVVLPSPSGKDDDKKPSYYATTGVPLLINKLCVQYGCTKQELEIKIFGGANSIHEKDVFRIGRRNIETVKSILSDMNLQIHKAEVGGDISRTIELDMETGNVKISTQPIGI